MEHDTDFLEWQKEIRPVFKKLKIGLNDNAVKAVKQTYQNLYDNQRISRAIMHASNQWKVPRYKIYAFIAYALGEKSSNFIPHV